MACLGDIRNIGFNITNGKSATVKLIHTIIFGVQSRLNRTKLNSFKGFKFEINSEEYQTKVDEVKNLLTIADLISVCNILGIDYTGTEEEITKRIISNLCHIEDIGIEDGNTEDEDEEREELNEQERAYEPARSIRSDVVSEVRQITDSFSLSFRDVEDSIKPFDGKDGYPIVGILI